MAHRWRRLAPLWVLGTPLLTSACGGGLGSWDPSPDGNSTQARIAEAAHNLTELADDMRQNGNLAGAASMYRQAHALNPNDVAPLLALGEVLTQLGDTVQAAQAYGMAQSMAPRNAQPLLGLGTTGIAMAQPQFAASQFAAALAADSKDVRAYNGFGVASDLAGDHAAAQDSYRAGLALDPGNRALLNNLGLSLALGGNRGEAIKVLEQLARAPDATPLHRQNLALAYGLAGQVEQAARLSRMDLDEPAVQQNLAYYANHRDSSGDLLLASLGVELRGVHFDATESTTSVGRAAPYGQAIVGSAEPVSDVVNDEADASTLSDLSTVQPAAGTSDAGGAVDLSSDIVAYEPTAPVEAITNDPTPLGPSDGLVGAAAFPGPLTAVVHTELAPLPGLVETQPAESATPSVQTIGGFVGADTAAAAEDPLLDEIAPAAGGDPTQPAATGGSAVTQTAALRYAEPAPVDAGEAQDEPGALGRFANFLAMAFGGGEHTGVGGTRGGTLPRMGKADK